jgi:hypothetical protein
LRDFARAGHQLLVFTCHDHIYTLFKSLKVETHRLPSSADVVASTDTLDDELPVAKKHRKQKSKPAPEPAALDEPVEEEEEEAAEGAPWDKTEEEEEAEEDAEEEELLDEEDEEDEEEEEEYEDEEEDDCDFEWIDEDEGEDAEAA